MSARGDSERIPPAIRDAARDVEVDRYVAALLAPHRVAGDLVLLAGLVAEIGRVPRQIRDPMIGEIRLQWWRDAVASAAVGTTTGHPVVDAAIPMLARHGITASDIDPLIDARLPEVHRELFADEADLLANLDAGEGGAFRLALRIAGCNSAERAARAAGLAYGLARRLGHFELHLALGGFPVPVTRLQERDIEMHALSVRPLEAKTIQGLMVCCTELRALARHELAEARAAADGLYPLARAVLLPLAMVEPYFAVQERMASRGFERPADVSPMRRFWRLWRASRTGRF